jgi:hypothetical protein
MKALQELVPHCNKVRNLFHTTLFLSNLVSVLSSYSSGDADDCSDRQSVDTG